MPPQAPASSCRSPRLGRPSSRGRALRLVVGLALGPCLAPGCAPEDAAARYAALRSRCGLAPGQHRPRWSPDEGPVVSTDCSAALLDGVVVVPALGLRRPIRRPETRTEDLVIALYNIVAVEAGTVGAARAAHDPDSPLRALLMDHPDGLPLGAAVIDALAPPRSFAALSPAAALAPPHGATSPALDTHHPVATAHALLHSLLHAEAGTSGHDRLCDDAQDDSGPDCDADEHGVHGASAQLLAALTRGPDAPDCADRQAQLAAACGRIAAAATVGACAALADCPAPPD